VSTSSLAQGLTDRSGVHWLDYPQGAHPTGLTARESLSGVGNVRLPKEHYGSRFRWGAGEDAPPLDDRVSGVNDANGVKI